MDNYQFCVQWVLDQPPPPAARVLDYGCGDGRIVKDLRSRGIDAFGCDVFYEGGNYSKYIEPSLLGSVIRRMEGSVRSWNRLSTWMKS